MPETPVGLLLTSDEEIGSEGAQVAARALAGARTGAVVVCGPGTPAVMHARDEYVEVAELEQAVRVFGEVVSRWR